jgi:hypothetical protein
MATIEICSGLDAFRLIACITGITPEAISGQTNAGKRSAFTGLEAMAQLAALHVRYCLQFQRHAFLLKVHRCRMPNLQVLEGRFCLSARLHSKSSNAFAYDVAADGPNDVQFTGRIIIGSQSYDDHFQKSVLSVYYQNLFADLMVDQKC